MCAQYHQYQVVGRHVPSEKEPEPKVYRMKMWAQDAVRAKSKFCGPETIVKESVNTNCRRSLLRHKMTYSPFVSPPYRYFLSKLKKVKKINGQVIACNEVGQDVPKNVEGSSSHPRSRVIGLERGFWRCGCGRSHGEGLRWLRWLMEGYRLSQKSV
eukprot:402427-Pyramimonas_sp.AAC.1